MIRIVIPANRQEITRTRSSGFSKCPIICVPISMSTFCMGLSSWLRFWWATTTFTPMLRPSREMSSSISALPRRALPPHRDEQKAPASSPARKHTGAGDEVPRSYNSQWNPLALYGMNAGRVRYPHRPPAHRRRAPAGGGSLLRPGRSPRRCHFVDNRAPVRWLLTGAPARNEVLKCRRKLNCVTPRHRARPWRGHRGSGTLLARWPGCGPTCRWPWDRPSSPSSPPTALRSSSCRGRRTPAVPDPGSLPTWSPASASWVAAPLSSWGPTQS